MRMKVLAGIGGLALSGAAPGQGGFVTMDDYPPEAVRHNWQGTAIVTVVAGEDGRVNDCRITTSSGHDVLDRATCAMMLRRGRYSPATDRDGHPIPSTHSFTVNWALR